MVSLVNFSKHLKEDEQFFTKSLINKNEMIFHNSFFETIKTQISEPDKNIIRR